ncbi:NAD(+) diphosphatase [Treponema brennaborense]|uniref:NAD(+) diphosphatase n=1 Tax=Treponema brennaborense (strain DSM 12168 / CIP 105900 / DD5/3) TaxID=906968 RepID=F4LQ72_TREBD|nr:NAD(+) diphosphatase [Treponema brennaborense]AEE16093.1 NAD(+) diphosphatase [Treponema brennaborense DSM 12168]
MTTQENQNGYTFIFRGNHILVADTNELILPDADAGQKCLEYQLASDWFSEPDYQYTALLLEDSAPEPAGYVWAPLRALFAEQHPASACASRALGLLNWRTKARFCSKCGGPLHDDPAETARTCILCGRTYFPSLSPAMIVLVSKDDKILLARHKQRNTDIFTCLAGYVEHGENLEQCVAREVREEAGIKIANITYVASQSWPFPDQLMLAFTADWKSGELVPEASEIQELCWFSRDKLPSIPKKGSVAYKLIMNEFKNAPLF